MFNLESFEFTAITAGRFSFTKHSREQRFSLHQATSCLIFFLSIFLFFLSFVDLAFAEPTAEKKLNDLRLKAELHEQMLVQSQKEILNLKLELTNLDNKINENSSKEQSLRKDLVQIDSSIEEMNSQIIVNKGKLSILNESFRARLRAIYKMQKGSSVLDYFANAKSFVELLKKRRFLTDIAESDKQLLDAVNEAVSALEDGVRRLAQLRTRRQETLSELTLLLANLNKDKELQVELIKKKEIRRQSIKTALQNLRSAADELEKSLSGLIEKHAPTAELFKLVVGSLLYPVKGEILHGFGKRKHQEFSDFVFSKGIEIKTEQSASVKAVAKGKVLLAQELPGYGMVMIVDHGARVYSLYARVTNLLKKVGDQIDAGQKIAQVEEDKNFYFELRKLGKAIDPSPYLIK